VSSTKEIIMTHSIASFTKAQLIAHIASLDAALLEANRDRDALRLRVSIATRNAPAPRAAYVPRPRVLPEAMIAARALAMATGRCVKVGA
jgi:hypothetical protein